MDINHYIEKLKALFNQLRDRIQIARASKRDKRALVFSIVALSVLVLFIIFQFFSSGTGKLTKKANILETELKKIGALREQFVETNRTIIQLTSSITTGDEALISVVENILVGQQIDRGSFSIKDSNPSMPAVDGLYDEKSVDVEIKKIQLNKMIDLLYGIQTRPSFLKVSKLRIRTRFDNPDLMDVTFRISRFEFNKEI